MEKEKQSKSINNSEEYEKYDMINRRLGIKRYLSFKEFSKLKRNNPIDVEEFFKELSDKAYDKNVETDKYILENEERKKRYSKDWIFMQTYALLGKYTFDNKTKFVEAFNKIYNALDEDRLEEVEEMIAELGTIQFEKESLNQNINDENDRSIVNTINEVFSNDVVKKSLSEVINNPIAAYEVSEFSFTGECGETNYYRMQEMISDIANYVILHRSTNGIEKYVEKLKTIYNSEIPENEKKRKIKEMVSISVSSRLGIKLDELNNLENKRKLFDYMYSQYIDNGYMFTDYCNDGDRESIDTQKVRDDISQKINSIFSEQGFRKICTEDEKDFFRFYDVEEETIEFPETTYYQGLGKAYRTGISNNGLIRFMSSTNPNIIGTEYDRLAFDKQDFSKCIANLKNLCENMRLSEAESCLIIEYFNSLWKNEISNSVNFPNIGMVARDKLNEDEINRIDEYRKKIDTLSLEEIYNIIIGENTKEKKTLVNIPEKNISRIELPKLGELTSAINTEPDKFIMTASGKKIRPDIVVNADTYDIDVLCISDVENNQIAVDETGLGTHIDLILVPENTDIHATPFNGSVAFQSNAMIVAVNGTPISEKGKKLIERFRKYYDIDYVAQFYLAMSSVLLNITDDNEHFTKNKRTKLADRAISDLIPKAIYMLKYKKYPEGIKFSEDYEEFDNELYRQLSVMRKNDDLYEEKFAKVTDYAKEKVFEYMNYSEAMEILNKELLELGSYEGFEKKFGISLRKFFPNEVFDIQRN